MTVRPAGAGDLEAIASLQRRTALEAYAAIFPPQAPKPSIEGLVEQWRPRVEAGAVVVAEDGGGIVGSVAGLCDGGLGELAGMYVDPARWRRGIGDALHRVALERMQTAGVEEARLWVLERNTAVRDWYERRGWELVPGETRTVWGPVVDVRYRRSL